MSILSFLKQMNKLSYLQTQVSQFLTKSFTPISISAPAKEWKTLNYNNKLFIAEITPNKQYISHYTSEKLKENSGIIFTSPYFHSIHTANKMVSQPAIFIARIIDEEFCSVFHSLDVYSKNDDDIITFNTKGRIPNRWIRMLHDFYFVNSSIEEGEISTEFWDKKIQSIPDIVLKSILNISKQMMNVNMNIKVNKAPLYTKNETKNIDFFWSSKTKMSEDDINKSIKNRIWKTENGSVSPAVRVFIERCKNYKSYYGGEYSLLFAYEGGLEFSYFRDMPWFSIRSLLESYSSYSSNYYAEIRGHDNYSSSMKYVPTEEMVILEEALKKEGADITVKLE